MNKKTIKIGIWLEASPYSKWSFDGISRVVSWLVEGSLNKNVTYLFCLPEWMINDVKANLVEINPEILNIIQFQTTDKTPIVLKLLARRQDDYVAFSLKRFLKNKFDIIFDFFLVKVTGIYSYWLVLLLSILALPFVIVIGLLGTVAYLLYSIAVKLFASKVSQFFLRKIRSSDRRVFDTAMDNLYSKLANEANRQKPDVWFVPFPGYQSARYLKGPIVTLFPDFVAVDCPTGFQVNDVVAIKEKVNKVLQCSTLFISLSEHVKRHHLGDVFSIPPERVFAIPNAAPDISDELEFLHADRYWSKSSRTKSSKLINKYLLKQYSRKSSKSSDFGLTFLQNFPFDESRYIFLSTQNRNYKNILLVARSLYQLKKEHQFSLKIIMTGAIDYDNHEDKLVRFIRENRLEADIISIPFLPNNILAALYHCAAITIHSSFFEGGTSAFPFYEGVSVGTPVLLSRNKATLESLNTDEFREYLFDPHSHDELSQKILDVLANRQEVFEAQYQVYKEFRKNDWEAVTQKYIDVFHRAINM